MCIEETAARCMVDNDALGAGTAQRRAGPGKAVIGAQRILG